MPPLVADRLGQVMPMGWGWGLRMSSVRRVLRTIEAVNRTGLPAVLTRVRVGGTFHVVTRIPATKTPGRYGITARCGGGNLGVLAHLRVLS